MLFYYSARLSNMKPWCECDSAAPHKVCQFYIVTKDWAKNIFSVTVYCKEKDMNISREFYYLDFLFAKYELSKMGYAHLT